MKRSVNISLASFPNRGAQHAFMLARDLVESGVGEPLFKSLSLEHVQLVPQSSGCLTEAVCDGLKASPGTQFRLHANVRVLPQHRDANLSNMREHMDWFERAAEIHRYLGAEVYTAHSGLRSDASFDELLDNTKRCADLFGSPVAIEGQYPSKREDWMISTWGEYRALYESGVPYVIDLSHLNIVATQSGVIERTLVTEMLACDRMLELHVSENDGTGDWHQVCESEPWWFDLLDHVHDEAVIFSEGNHARRRNQSF